MLRYLREFARVLAPRGEAFVQLPVLDAGACRGSGAPLRGLRSCRRLERLSRDPARASAFRGFRLTEAELDARSRSEPACASSPATRARTRRTGTAATCFLRLEHG